MVRIIPIAKLPETKPNVISDFLRWAFNMKTQLFSSGQKWV